MSDDTDPTSDETTPADVTETPLPSPAPKPRSAASRARRIGGAAAPRPDAATSDAPTVGIAKQPAKNGKAAASDAKTTKASAKAPDEGATKASGKASARVGTKAAGKPATRSSDDAPEKARTVTFSVPGWLRWAPGFAFAATAVVFLTLFAVARIGGDDAPASTSSSMRQEVLAAAKTCLATLNTYRYDQIAQAETAGAKCTTGKLTSDYKKTVSTVIRKNAPPLKAVQLAKINAAGIEQVTKDGKQWTILAYGQLNITTANTGKQGRIDPFAVIARMQQVKGKWVISKVDTVSSFSQ